jgi:hypothetical protein
VSPRLFVCFWFAPSDLWAHQFPLGLMPNAYYCTGLVPLSALSRGEFWSSYSLRRWSVIGVAAPKGFFEAHPAFPTCNSCTGLRFIVR